MVHSNARRLQLPENKEALLPLKPFLKGIKTEKPSSVFRGEKRKRRECWK